MLNKRITKWIDDNEIIGEEQAGFRQERSTFDHLKKKSFSVSSETAAEAQKTVCGFY